MTQALLRGTLKSCLKLLSILAVSACVSQAEVIYDNTTGRLNTFWGEAREFGDQLTLGGTARTITDIQFQYYGDFVSQGDEWGRVRLYTNTKQWDLFRKEPTELIWDSGLFKVNTSYNTKSFRGLNIVVPEPLLDGITLTFEVTGLEPGEMVGFELYDPPSVGASFGEFWRRAENGAWEAFRFNEPEFRLNAAIRLTAVPEPSTWVLLGLGALFAASRRFRR